MRPEPENHVKQAIFSKLCFDCRNKLDTRNFKAKPQNQATVGSEKASDPYAYILIHEYTYKTGVSSTDEVTQAADTDELGWEPKWEQQWERKWVTDRWLIQCRSTEEELLDIKTLRIQLDDEKYGTMDDNYIIGRDDIFLDIRADVGDPAAKYISSREFNTNPRSSANTELANSWVDQCFQTHKACRPHLRNSLPPTRVLDIGEQDLDGICIIATSGRSGKYAALSYCWGQKQLQQTAADNLTANFESIDLESLSSTIKDAITVTRSLGLRYIWIDALCIIQDSAEDKKKELANMANIYENASVTIIAASAAGADEGFLKPKPIPKIDLRIPYGQGAILLRR